MNNRKDTFVKSQVRIPMFMTVFAFSLVMVACSPDSPSVDDSGDSLSSEEINFIGDLDRTTEEGFGTVVPGVPTYSDLENLPTNEVLEEIETVDVPMQTEEVLPTDFTPTILRQGQFVDAGGGYTGSGSATIFKLSDGSHRLSFRGFSVCCGPDLYVYLANNPSPASHADLGDYVEIDSLIAITGDQDYQISSDIDLSLINSVVIYCKPFEVIISTATLN
jgi:hypothetical protein